MLGKDIAQDILEQEAMNPILERLRQMSYYLRALKHNDLPKTNLNSVTEVGLILQTLRSK